MARFGLWIVCLMIAPVCLADAVTDAKRKAANDLLRGNKADEAITMIQEVLKADKSNFRDYLTLARAYEKLNKTTEAAEAWRKVAELLPSPPTNAEERAAKSELDKRLKVLEAQVAKVRAVEEEVLKKLEPIEREAIAARDAAAVRRIFRLKGGVYAARGNRASGSAEVWSAALWAYSGVNCVSGRTYRIRAVGTHFVKPGVESTADGTDLLPANGAGRIGVLMGTIAGSNETVVMGSDYRLKARHSGELHFYLNDIGSEKPENTGAVTVLVEEE